jgi:hypothetical protein
MVGLRHEACPRLAGIAKLFNDAVSAPLAFSRRHARSGSGKKARAVADFQSRMVQQPDSTAATGATPPEPAAALRRPPGRRWGLLLLLIPFVALLYPPFYASVTPRLAGIPFFIWYQFLWVIIGVSITGVVYAIDRVREGTP